MKYLSIDIETTGLNPATCDMVEFAAVIADSCLPLIDVEELPSFHRYIAHETFRGEPYALSMHPHIFRAIATLGPPDCVAPSSLCDDFKQWLGSNNLPTSRLAVAGKNFGAFDLQFLKNYKDMTKFFGHRFLDPAPYFFNPFKDEKLPDLATCLSRAGYSKDVAHGALEDAQDVIRCLNYAFVNFSIPFLST